MSTHDERTQLAIDRLVPVLRQRLPSLFDTLAPPVTDDELELLRRAIDPYEVPAELETWLRFSNGQRFDVVSVWPVFDFCPFWPASTMAEFYPGGHEFQPPGLLAIGYQSHYQVSIELVAADRHCLIDTTVDSPDWRVLAPSLADMADVVRRLVESGELDDWPLIGPKYDDVAVYQARSARHLAAVTELSREGDWSTAPAPFGEYFRPESFTERWGSFPLG